MGGKQNPRQPRKQIPLRGGFRFCGSHGRFVWVKETVYCKDRKSVSYNQHRSTPKKKNVHSPLKKEGRFHFPSTKQTEDRRKTPLTPTEKYSKIEIALRGTGTLCERKVTAKKLTPHSVCFIGF